MNDTRGSTWRIWDLHVHTPDSIVQNYGGNSEEIWLRFLRELEELPPSVKVLGINDYIFLDGYRRILAERQKGRLGNIDLVLPVIELRLDKFEGTDSRLSRVNFHVIFSDELDPETIQHQFINCLPSAYKLSPRFLDLEGEWSGVPTRASLEDLGRKIIASVPEKERRRFGEPLLEGFNNLNVRLEDILQRLNVPYFRGKYVTAVGKTEWWNIKWNDHSIADKKTIINSADLVFIAVDKVEDFHKAKESLKESGVNDRLLDCSDAHSFSASEMKDRLGNCLTWIKGDPTFQGLRHLLIEPDERVYVGKIPPQITMVERNKTRYIRSVSIKKAEVSRKRLNEKWFDADLILNHGLVAIIGNKGSGKSALADIIGLLGSSRNQDSFSFLNPDKFRKMPENKARYFEGELQWESGDSVKIRLDAEADAGQIERVKYIPQNYFEAICTQLPGVEETAFDRELKTVIFSHVGEAERLGKDTLDALINYKSSEITEALDQARQKMEKLNKEIATRENMLTEEYRRNLESQLTAKKGELDALAKPPKVKKPSKTSTRKTEALKRAEEDRQKLEAEITQSKEQRKEVVDAIAKVERLIRKVENFEEKVQTFREELEGALGELEFGFDEIVRVEVNKEPLERAMTKYSRERERVERLLDSENEVGLSARLKVAKEGIVRLRDQLDMPSKAYETYLEEVAKWEGMKREAIGDPKKLGSIANLEWQLGRLNEIPSELSELYEKRRRQARVIFRGLQRHKAILADLYAPVQKFISEHPDIGQKIDLNFGVSIMELGFAESFFEWINQGKTGSFMGAAEGRRMLNEMLTHYDFNDEESAIAFADQVIAALQVNKNMADATKVQVEDQLKKGKTVESLYTAVFSFEYLQARYVLRLGEKELRQLSPGERGALLIVFYLLVDLDTIPLVVDQPEHNLDNETVTKLLVPAIKKAKLRRQLIMVTHNPILAVVCNADQVIAASLDIKDDHKVEYMSGAIENPVVNRRIVDVLEGTMYAFDNRQKKYIREYLETFQTET